MFERRRVIRGDHRGAGLQEQLSAQAPDTAHWMRRHTQLLKSDAYSLVGLLPLQGELCCLKLYRHKSALQHVLFRLGLGRPVRSFDVANELLASQVPVPRPHACLLVPEGMLLLTEGLWGGMNLAELWQRQAGDEQAGQLLQDAGAAMARLHRAGYAHGDCKWHNLLGAAGLIYLIDLDGAGKAPPGGARQARDIARFTLNAEELDVAMPLYEFFLTSYLQGVGRSRSEVIASMMPLLHTLRARHMTRYGVCGKPLF